MNISFLETFKKVTSVTLIFGLVFSTLTPAAFAATVSAVDSFGSSDTNDVPGWIDGGGSEDSDSRTSNNESRSGSSTNHHARLRDGGYITKTVNTTGYENIKLKYYWRWDNDGDNSTGNIDTLDVYWKKTTDSTFILLNSYLMDGNDVWSSQVTSSLPATANNTSIDIRFVGNSNNNNEEGRVDDVSLEGDVLVADTTAPTISEITPVPSPANDTTPNYTFTTNEAGTITYGGDCSSSTTAAWVGSNTITFNTLGSGTHSNCTVRVTDASSNASNILTVNSFTVDTTAPLLSLPSNITQEATSNSGATATFSATSTDVDPVNPTVTCTPSSGSTFPIATTTVNCSATDTVGNISNGSFTVTVQDTTKPVITLNGGTVNLNVGDTYTEQGATATDIVDGDLTASVTVGWAVVNTATPGAYIVTYNVTDAHGNAATTASRTVNVSDVTAPVISGIPSDIVVEQVGNAAATVTYTNPTANDDVDGSVAVLCSPASGSAFSYGLTAVLCNATDLASNVANASFNVTVQDTIAPTATSVVVTSDNANTSLAKEGNTITISFTTSEPVNTPTATIAGKTATVTNVSGNDYTATYTLTAAETQGTAAITIDFTDIVGNNATQVTATTDSSSVTIDTVAPIISSISSWAPAINSADISWLTNENTNSQVEYGENDSYWSFSPTYSSFVTNHSIIISSLTENKKYYYRVISEDLAGNKTISPGEYFTTGSSQERSGSVGGGGPYIEEKIGGNSDSTTPTPTTPTPTTPETTPTPESTPTTPTENITPQANPEENNPSPTPTPTPTAPVTGGGTGTPTGGTTGPAFNPADATLDIGGAGTPEETPVVEETTPTVDPTLDAGGWVIPEENSYTLLWTLLALIALLNTWWFFVAKNKNQPTHRRD